MSRNVNELLRFAVPLVIGGVAIGVVGGGIGGALVGGVIGAVTQAYTGSSVMITYAYIGGGISATIFGVVALVVSSCIIYSTTTAKTGF